MTIINNDFFDKLNFDIRRHIFRFCRLSSKNRRILLRTLGKIEKNFFKKFEKIEKIILD